MKRMLAGGVMLLSGILLYIGTGIAAVLYMPSVTGWETTVGRFQTALHETGGAAAHVLAIWLAAFGLAVIVYECFLQGIILRYYGVFKQRNVDYEQKYE